MDVAGSIRIVVPSESIVGGGVHNGVVALASVESLSNVVGLADTKRSIDDIVWRRRRIGGGAITVGAFDHCTLDPYLLQYI